MKKYCKQCNTELNDEFKYCPNCGMCIEDVNELIEKLYCSINWHLYKNLELEKLILMKLVPINLRERNLFVVVGNSSDKDEINQYLSSRCEYILKFIQLADFDLATLLINVIKQQRFT